MFSKSRKICELSIAKHLFLKFVLLKNHILFEKKTKNNEYLNKGFQVINL